MTSVEQYLAQINQYNIDEALSFYATLLNRIIELKQQMQIVSSDEEDDDIDIDFDIDDIFIDSDDENSSAPAA